jgi:sterol 3beta-glucosyltransferase
MNILILTAGSRGDVQPFVALGKALQAAGYDVTFAGPAMFEGFAAEHALRFSPIDDGILRLKDTPQGAAALEGKGNKLALIKQAMPMLRRMLDDAWRSAQNADAIVYHPKAMAGLHIAEARHIPAFMSLPLPAYTPTREFPNPILPLRGAGWLNRLGYTLVPILSAPYVGVINRWRAEMLGLPPRSRFASELIRADGSRIPVLYSFSRHVVPRPADWDESAHVTGYWFLDQPFQPNIDLVRFLDAGEPPVYVGFGSMVSVNARAKAELILEALRRTGQRSVIATGWGGLEPGDLPADVFALREAPHEWLFPRMAAVVHHGGAGTTAAGLRAGIPTVICPFFGDQPFWGERVSALGVGPSPIPQRRLSADLLVTAIDQALNDSEMRRRAAALGEAIRAENGLENALAVIARLVQPTPVAVL